MPEETKPEKQTLKSTNSRIDELEVYINNQATATQEYCKESIHDYNAMLSVLIRNKSDELYMMLFIVFSGLAVIEFLQLFLAIENVFMTTADVIFIGAKFFIYCCACWSCYSQGHLGENDD